MSQLKPRSVPNPPSFSASRYEGGTAVERQSSRMRLERNGRIETSSIRSAGAANTSGGRQWARTLLAAGALAGVTAGCDGVTDPNGTVRLVASKTITGAELADASDRALPFIIEPGEEWTFEGPFDDPPEAGEYPIDRLQSASAQFRFDTNLDLGAVVDVIMSSGNKRCVLAKNMHAREQGAAPVTWSSLCTDIFFSPDRVVDIHVASTNDQEVTVGPDDSVTVSVHAVFNFK